MATNPSNVLKLLAMLFPGYQITEDYSNFEEEIANGIFGKISSVLRRKVHIFVDYFEDIMEDREDRLLEAFLEDVLPEHKDTILPILMAMFHIEQRLFKPK
ncbi:hypothetical protein L596_027316 [Steinernema carpocapsae]|uniref:Uncharacterized protein n=1 Tax=Steinernema carpocapsae TaxID=34508 RepID=A0A4U5M449_STECR|nr:hypothetical protein L596_027316 [Steinernema carpocapsae]